MSQESRNDTETSEDSGDTSEEETDGEFISEEDWNNNQSIFNSGSKKAVLADETWALAETFVRAEHEKSYDLLQMYKAKADPENPLMVIELNTYTDEGAYIFPSYQNALRYTVSYQFLPEYQDTFGTDKGHRIRNPYDLLPERGRSWICLRFRKEQRTSPCLSGNLSVQAG